MTGQLRKLCFSTFSGDGVITCDRVRLYVRAGNGGQGLQRYNGTGGDGGDVVMVGHPKMTLATILKNFKGGVMKVQAGHGSNSSQLQLVGTAGRPKILKVPVGVDVVNIETKRLIARCSRPFFNYVIARGGRGGCADNCFQATTGERYLADLHFKLHPNIGLVGFPNAGKSTLMKALVPKKQIKIANYPFTTVKPQIAYIEDFETASNITGEDDLFSLSIADLPGLLEGAAVNRGRGQDFLKHLEYSDILLLVIDVFGFKLDLSFSNPYRNALETIALLNIELEKYDLTLTKKPTVIVLNKIDLGDGERRAEELVTILNEKKWLETLPEELQPFQPLIIEAVVPIAAKDGRLGNLKSQLKRIYRRLHPLSAPDVAPAAKTILI